MKNNNNLNKEITLSAIAELIEASAKKTVETLEAKIESSVGDLATMTQNQFLELGVKVDGIDKRLIDVEDRLINVEDRLITVEKKVDRIEGEIIKKVNTIDHNTAKYRIKKLEEKFA